MKVDEALENVYTAVQNDNDGIDESIAGLKAAMKEAGEKTAEIDCARLLYNNRQGKKLMKSYFKKRGVKIEFVNGN